MLIYYERKVLLTNDKCWLVWENNPTIWLANKSRKRVNTCRVKMTGRASQQCQDDRAGLLASGGQPRGWTIDRTWEIQAAASDVFFVFLRIRHHHLFCYILFSAPIFRMSGWQRIFCTRLWLQEIRYVYSSGRDDDAWSGVVWLWEAPTKFSHNSAACLLHYRICVQTAAIKKKISQFTAIIIIKTIPLLRKCQRLTNPVPHSPSQQWWYCTQDISPGEGAFPIYEYLIF